MKKALVATIVTFIVIAQAIAQSRKRFDFESQLGVVDENPQKELCLTIANPNLIEGSRITLLSPYRPQRMAKAVIEKRLTKSCSTNSDVIEAGSFFYSLKLVEGYAGFLKKYEPNPPAIAVIGRIDPIKIRKGIASV